MKSELRACLGAELGIFTFTQITADPIVWPREASTYLEAKYHKHKVPGSGWNLLLAIKQTPLLSRKEKKQLVTLTLVVFVSISVVFSFFLLFHPLIGFIFVEKWRLLVESM